MSVITTKFSDLERTSAAGISHFETLEPSAERQHLLLVGWQGPPFNGRVHVVSSLMQPPFTDRFTFSSYDTRIRNHKGGSRPDQEFARDAITQITRISAAVRACNPTAAVFFTGPGPTFWRDLLILRALRKTGLPILIRFFGGSLTEQLIKMPTPLHQLAMRELSHAKAFLVETNAMIEDLAGLCPKIPARRVPNFIHLSSLPRPKTVAQSLAPPFRVMYLGNMTPAKGVETILASVDAVCDALESTTPVEFHFIGGEIDEGYLAAFGKKLAKIRHSGAVTMHGKMARTEAHALAATGDVFAFPTRWPGEGQPAALIEAMGMGLVPVAARWRGVAEIVRNGENGILLDSPDDAESLARALIALAKNPRERLWLASAARAHIASNYDAVPALEQFSRIVKRAIASSATELRYGRAQ